MSVTLQSTAADRGLLLARFQRVRQASVAMCASLEPAEYRMQPLDDVSPPWWNLGHTSWFFARNVLAEFGGEQTGDDEAYDYLLNSYYASLGERLPRGRRGQMTRPTTEEIYKYRESVDRRIVKLVENVTEEGLEDVAFVLRIGIEHEQQHQELFYTEIKSILAQNPPALRRNYASGGVAPSDGQARHRPLNFVSFEGGLNEFGNREGGWCWDNELPVHKYYLEPFSIGDRLITNGEYLEFMSDGGYANQLLWLDNGWQQCQTNDWSAPLCWERSNNEWQEWTLHGFHPLPLNEPACHVSFYEADAFARWKSETFETYRSVRLPSEREWEHAARTQLESLSSARETAFLESIALHARADCQHSAHLREMFGTLWQWTASYYEPYPGYRPFPGVLAEYNGKFMDNQRVLRGGSCVTQRDHFRISYRNFWLAGTRFQFTGIRLARDC